MLDETFDDLTYPFFVLRQYFDVYQHSWLVADHPTGLLGYALGAPGPDHRSAWLLGHVVGADHRRRGHGRALVLRCLQILRTAGVHRVYLTVKPTNTIAIQLYETIGFTIKYLAENYFGPDEDRFLMELDL